MRIAVQRSLPTLLVLFTLSLATVFAESITINRVDIDTPLKIYGYENHTYRNTIVNLSILIHNDNSGPVYNLTIVRAIGAELLGADMIRQLKPYEEAALNTSLLIPEDASLGSNNITLILRFYTYPEPVEICNSSKGNFTLYVCTLTNITSTQKNYVYVYTWPYRTRNIIIWRNGVAIVNTTIYDWNYFYDPYPGSAHYVVQVCSDDEGCQVLELVAEEARPQIHYVNTSFTIIVVPRNVTRLNLWIDPANSSVCIVNPARVEDVGQLIAYNVALKIYNTTFSNETLENILVKVVEILEIPQLRANQTLCFSIPWNLTEWPFVNATAEVCDDVHGCYAVNRTWILFPIPTPCKIVIRVTDDWGNPIEGATIVLGNATAVTDEHGVAVLESTAIGDATVLYQDKKVTIYILGCGNYTAVIDTHPPKLLYHDVGEGFVKIRFEDYSSVYVVVDNGVKHGPYRDTAFLWISGKHRLCLVDEYNNSGPCIDIDVPRPREPPYTLIALLALVLGATLYVGFALMTRGFSEHR